MTPLVEAIRNWKKPMEETEGGVKVTSAVWTLDPDFIGMPIGNETTKAIGNFVDDKLMEYAQQKGLDPVPNRFWAVANYEERDDSRVMTEIEGINVQALRERAIESENDRCTEEEYLEGETQYFSGDSFWHQLQPPGPRVYNNQLLDDHVASQGEIPGRGLRFVDVPEEEIEQTYVQINRDRWTAGNLLDADQSDQEPHIVVENTHASCPAERPQTVRDYFQRQPPHCAPPQWLLETPFPNDRQMIIRLMKPEIRLDSETPSAYVTNYEINYRAMTIAARLIIAPNGYSIQQKQWFDLCTPEAEPDTLEEKVKRVIWENMNVGIVGRYSLDSVSSSEAVALETLRGMVDRYQFRRYLKDGFLVVTGNSGLRYQIFRDKWHTKVWDGGNLVEEICVRLADRDVPPSDNVIAFKCMIECDEDEFRRMGNIYNMRRAA